MIVTLSQRVKGVNGITYLCRSGLNFGNVVFIPLRPNAVPNLSKEYGQGTLVGIVGNPYDDELSLSDRQNSVRVDFVRLDKENMIYQCGFSKSNKTSYSAKNGKSYRINENISELRPYDINLREIKDMEFYRQMVEDFKNYMNSPLDDLRDTSFIFEYLKQFKNAHNPYSSDLRNELNRNRLLSDFYTNNGISLTVEQAEELRSFVSGMACTFLTDEYGNLDDNYVEYTHILDKIVDIAKVNQRGK